MIDRTKIPPFFFDWGERGVVVLGKPSRAESREVDMMIYKGEKPERGGLFLKKK